MSKIPNVVEPIIFIPLLYFTFIFLKNINDAIEVSKAIGALESTTSRYGDMKRPITWLSSMMPKTDAISINIHIDKIPPPESCGSILPYMFWIQPYI